MTTKTVGLGTLWIVTTARTYSELGDICFEASPSDLAFQVLGGLRPDEIIGWFDNYSAANQTALQELHRVGAYINGRPRPSAAPFADVAPSAKRDAALDRWRKS